MIIQRIKAAQPQTHLTSTFLGCLTAMSEGDVSSLTGDHWVNALRSGGITAAFATVVAGVGIKVNKWSRAAMCGLTTFGVEMIAQSPTYGTSRGDIAMKAMVAGAIASVLALVAGRMFEKFMPVEA